MVLIAFSLKCAVMGRNSEKFLILIKLMTNNFQDGPKT